MTIKIPITVPSGIMTPIIILRQGESTLTTALNVCQAAIGELEEKLEGLRHDEVKYEADLKKVRDAIELVQSAEAARQRKAG